MNSELRHTPRIWKRRLIWGSVYISIVAAVLGGLYIVASRYRTQSVPEGDIILTLNHSKFVVGEEVIFTLKNGYNSDIFVSNECPKEPLNVYRKEGNAWVRVHDNAAKDCKTQDRLVKIPANGVVSSSFAAWPRLFEKPGTYRIVAYVEYYNAIPYQDFEVVAKPVASTSTPGVSESTAGTAPTAIPDPAPAPAPPPAATPAEPAEEELTQDTIRVDGGQVRVAYSDSVVYVQSVTPNSGCTSEGGGQGREVQITFKCGENETQLQLFLRNGQLLRRVEGGDD